MECFLDYLYLLEILAGVMHLILEHEGELNQVSELDSVVANRWVVEVDSSHFVAFDYVSQIIIQESESLLEARKLFFFLGNFGVVLTPMVRAGPSVVQRGRGVATARSTSAPSTFEAASGLYRFVVSGFGHEPTVDVNFGLTFKFCIRHVFLQDEICAFLGILNLKLDVRLRQLHLVAGVDLILFKLGII